MKQKIFYLSSSVLAACCIVVIATYILQNPAAGMVTAVITLIAGAGVVLTYEDDAGNRLWQMAKKESQEAATSQDSK